MAKAKVSKAPEDLLQELVELEAIHVSLDAIFLDPNNPRFMHTKHETTPDDKIAEPPVQKKALERMGDENLTDLKENIKKVGFLLIDRVVVRPFAGKKYVVAEGNRRIASLKQLQTEHKEEGIQLPDSVLARMKDLEVLEYKGSRKDIAWTIQGIRHISGVRAWPPYQQAKFVVELVEKGGQPIKEVSKMIGVKQAEVASMVRSYYGFLQLEDHEEYGDQIDPEYFAMLREGVFARPSLKTWLGWSDSEKEFKNDENLTTFLSLITPKDGKDAAITRAIDVRDVLGPLVDTSDAEIHVLLPQFLDGTLSLEECRVKIATSKIEKAKDEEVAAVEPLKSDLQRMFNRLQTISIFAITKKKEDSDEVRKLLASIGEIAQFQIDQIEAKLKK